ncbi:hypothetical protein MHB81_04740 [Paenibacillus sp. FSL H7-0326]
MRMIWLLIDEPMIRGSIGRRRIAMYGVGSCDAAPLAAEGGGDP